MQKVIHFISGLARSGSTLLAAILRQNPRFHAGMSSPVASLFMALQGAMSRRNEAAVFIDEAQKCELLKGIFASYYHATPERVIFYTNRAWCSKLPTLVRLFPEAKVICCVRHVGWIMDSIERLIRENAFELSGIFGFESLNTVYTRGIGSRPAMGSSALPSMRYARRFGANTPTGLFWSATRHWPADTLKQLYDFLGEKWFARYFDNVEFKATSSISRSVRQISIRYAARSNGSNVRPCCHPSCSIDLSTTPSGPCRDSTPITSR
jgi:sulfotransferase